MEPTDSADLTAAPEQTEPLLFSELSSSEQIHRLQELALVFFRLGTVAFGGPTAHIAMMDDEVVKQRQWLTREQLLDLIGVTNLIPGPNSTELAIHIGYERGGWRGLLIAGSCFILPAMALVWLLAAIYVRYQTIPQVDWLLYGIKPVVIAVIAQALWKLGKKALKNRLTVAIALITIMAFSLGTNEILLLLLAGLGGMGVHLWQQRGSISPLWFMPMTGVLAQMEGASTAVAVSSPVSVLQVFGFFLKVGAVLYGSGYVLLAFLQRDLVEHYQWLTSQQLLDAIAIGQITPGPVFTTATFVGYLLAGHWGALAATVGIFLPAFAFVAILNPWVPKLRRSAAFSGFLDGVNAASLGLMTVVTVTLAQTTVVDWLTLFLALGAAVAVFRFKVNAAWLVLAGGAIGYLTRGLLTFT